MFKHYLKSTIEYIIDNFESAIKRHLTLSFKFLILSVVWSSFLCFIYFSFCYIIYGSANNSFDLFKILDDIQGRENNNFSILFGVLIILNTSLYSSFVISSINDTGLSTKETFSFKDFTTNISKEEVYRLLLLQAIIVAIYILTYKSFVALFYKWHFIGDSFSLSGMKSSSGRIASWLDSTIILTKTLLVYFLAIFFVVSIFEGKFSLRSISKYKIAIYASFCISLSVNMLLTYIDKVFEILFVGFGDALPYSSTFHLLPFVFSTVFYLLTFSLYAWVLATAFCMPIKIQFDEEQEQLENIETARDNGLVATKDSIS